MSGLGRFFAVLVHDLWVAFWCFMGVCFAGMVIHIAHDVANGRIPWPLP